MPDAFRIPEDFTEFLYWFKERTEAFWARTPRLETHGDYYEEWPAGTRWVGLTEAEIDAVEARYGVRFAPDHRAFLRVLHSLNQPYTSVCPASDDYEGHRTESYLSYNWLTQEAEIRRRLDNLYEDLHAHWLPVWGPKPAAAAQQQAAFNERFQRAPELLPIYGHRYVVSEPLQAGNPVLSAYWGADIIIFGWNLREYLLLEFGEYLDIPTESYFDEEDQSWYMRWIEAANAIREQGWATRHGRRIPFYEDFIQTWDGWPRRAEGQRYGPILEA